MLLKGKTWNNHREEGQARTLGTRLRWGILGIRKCHSCWNLYLEGTRTSRGSYLKFLPWYWATLSLGAVPRPARSISMLAHPSILMNKGREGGRGAHWPRRCIQYFLSTESKWTFNPPLHSVFNSPAVRSTQVFPETTESSCSCGSLSVPRKHESRTLPSLVRRAATDPDAIGRNNWTSFSQIYTQRSVSGESQ